MLCRRHPHVTLAAIVVAAVLCAGLWVRTPTAEGGARAFVFSERAVALTFDDGPHPANTPAILDILEEYDARATFFVLGEQAERHPEIIARMIDEGHEVAHHTHTHPHVDRLRESSLLREMDDCLTVLEAQGVTPSWYRPPRGKFTARQATFAAERGMKVALWARCFERTRFESADELATTLARETQRGEIILAHDGLGDRSMTVEALPMYLDALGESGINVVTLSELERSGPLFWKAERFRSAR